MASKNRPNLLMILSDQLRRDTLGCYSNPDISTPNIDRLATEGVRFSNACSTYPICVPYRFTLLTGTHAHSRFIPAIEWRMSPSERTLADEFNQAGYHTCYIGKWHLYGGHGLLPNHSERKTNLTWIPPEFQGRFQKWQAFDVANNPFDTYYFEDDDPNPRELGRYQTDGLTDLMTSYLRERAESPQPFAAILSVEPPHFPLQAPAVYLERWDGRALTLPPNHLFEDSRPSPSRKMGPDDLEILLSNRRTYYAMIENLDWNVGRILNCLQETGLGDTTWVVLTSDHGQMDGAHCGHSLQKDDPFEESIGVPLILRGPGQDGRRGQAIPDPTCSEDLFPTLLGLAGLAPARPGPGQDISPLVRGESTRLDRPGVYLEFVHDLRVKSPYHTLYWRGFRTQRYIYTVLGDARDGGKPWQLFDLKNDPYEMENLLDRPEISHLASELHQLLRQRLIETHDHYVLAPAYGLDGVHQWSHY